MFQLLQSIGLLAIAGILFPVIIHLWNKREGKTLKVGSVILLLETARQQARSLRLKDLLLLLLRCAIIILLAILLAKPVWQKQINTSYKKGWIVLDIQTREAYKNYKRLIDSLLLVGYQPHRFSPGFPIVKPDDTVHTNLPGDSLPYWALLKALNEQVPNELPVYLITSNRLNKISGTRPTVAMNLVWLTYTDADTTTGNLIVTRLLATDSTEVIAAHSTTSYTAYLLKKVAQQVALQYRMATLSPAAIHDSNASVLADTSVLRIAIFTEPNSIDATYLEAALNTIRQFGGYRIQVSTTTNVNKLATGNDWVFWLSQKPLPASLKKGNVFMYENGKEKAMYSWIETSSDHFVITEKIAVAKGIICDSSIGDMLWSNGFGEPLLSVEKCKNPVYHFYSRFNPAWNGIVWNENFPGLLFELLYGKKLKTNIKDNRTIALLQMQPVLTTTGVASKKQLLTETTDWSKPLWAMAFLLFALERFISLNQKKEVYA